MQDDCIAVALTLPQLKILGQRELGNRFEVTVIYRREEATCLRCSEVTNKVHDRRPQSKQDRRLRVSLTLMGAHLHPCDGLSSGEPTLFFYL